MTIKTDLLIIGSGPMSLVEAKVNVLKGRSVHLLEASNKLGGAWGTSECFGVPNIETSPHVFMPDRKANAVMQKFLPGEFEDLDPQPKLLIRSSKTFGDFRLMDMRDRYNEAFTLAVISHYENKKKNHFMRVWDTAISTKNTCLYRRKNGQTVNLTYPKTGLQDWLNGIEVDLTAHGVNLIKNARVDVIEKKGKVITVRAADGQDYQCKEICYTEQTSLKKLIIDGEEIPLSYEDDSSDHLLFVVDGKFDSPKPLGFWRLMKDSYLMFINDITHYSPEFRAKYPGKRLINTRVSAYRSFTPKKIKTFFSHIAYVGYMEKDVKMLDWHHKYLVRRKMTYAMRYRVKKLLGPSGYELVSGTVGLANGLRNSYGKYL
ncbi:MAG: NAD(P)-binding protein [Pseudomonadota bacterium]